jgi:hypothetical protein
MEEKRVTVYPGEISTMTISREWVRDVSLYPEVRCRTT